MDQLWLAVATHRVPAHGGVKFASYDINKMEWRIECRDGARLRFHGELERANGAGWPLLHPTSRIDQTLAIRPNEFETA